MAQSKIAISIPDPRFADWGMWSSEVSQGLRGFYMVESEGNWQRFARAALETVPLSQLSLPGPEGFKDWREWGRSIMEVTAGGA